jgi:hypothetical protein
MNVPFNFWISSTLYAFQLFMRLLSTVHTFLSMRYISVHAFHIKVLFRRSPPLCSYASLYINEVSRKLKPCAHCVFLQPSFTIFQYMRVTCCTIFSDADIFGYYMNLTLYIYRVLYKKKI